MTENLERNTLPIRKERHGLAKNLALAPTLPIVRSGFISKEQATYCMGWKDIVNPQSEPKVVLYNAMGPDVSTILLATNADTVYGVDFQPPQVTKLMYYLDHWDEVDTDATSLPPESDYYLDKYHLTSQTEEIANRELQRTLQLRNKRGYWDVAEMLTWSIDRCLVIELKKLGVDPKTIQVTEVQGKVQLEFFWAFPGEEPKQRKILYLAGTTYDIIDNPHGFNLPSLDGYYEKSMEINRWADMVKNDLGEMRHFIKPGGFVLIGRSHGTENEERELEEANRAALGSDFEPIFIDDEYKQMMDAALTSEYASKYGWDLYGAQKAA